MRSTPEKLIIQGFAKLGMLYNGEGRPAVASGVGKQGSGHRIEIFRGGQLPQSALTHEWIAAGHDKMPTRRHIHCPQLTMLLVWLLLALGKAGADSLTGSCAKAGCPPGAVVSGSLRTPNHRFGFFIHPPDGVAVLKSTAAIE